MGLAEAVKRAAAAAKPTEEKVERPDPYEVAAEELGAAKTSSERADVLRVIAELARLSK